MFSKDLLRYGVALVVLSQCHCNSFLEGRDITPSNPQNIEKDLRSLPPGQLYDPVDETDVYAIPLDQDEVEEDLQEDRLDDLSKEYMERKKLKKSK